MKKKTPRMNLASLLVNKCFEYLLNAGTGEERTMAGTADSSGQTPPGSSRSLALPPWVESSGVLQSNCDGCGACIAGCETGILVPDQDGCPWVDFSRGACSFCGKCAASCPRDVFDHGPSKKPWSLQAVVTLDCLTHNNVMCRTCVEHCEEEAIIVPKMNGAMTTPRVLKEKCSGCGACYGPCPVRAINMTGKGIKGKIIIQEEGR